MPHYEQHRHEPITMLFQSALSKLPLRRKQNVYPHLFLVEDVAGKCGDGKMKTDDAFLSQVPFSANREL